MTFGALIAPQQVALMPNQKYQKVPLIQLATDDKLKQRRQKVSVDVKQLSDSQIPSQDSTLAFPAKAVLTGPEEDVPPAGFAWRRSAPAPSSFHNAVTQD